jgi:hypothetical protein
VPRSSIAYLARRELHILQEDGSSEPVTSTFVEEVHRREASIRRKSEWKTHGTGARFMGARGLWDESEGRRQPAWFVCASRGRRAGEILYAISTGTVTGIFAYDMKSRTETRLVHGTDHGAVSIATSDEHNVVAIARRQKNGSCNLAVMRDEGGDSALVTEGDTLDDAPSWIPNGADGLEGRHRLLYHCAGIGRDSNGRIGGLAPTAIHCLDAEHGRLETVVEHPEFDYLTPRMRRDGTLYAMRRPYRSGPEAPSPGAMLKDSFLAPFRLMYAGFRYLDFFSMRYTGKPLATSGDTKSRNLDARRLVERQNVAAAETEGDDQVPRVPRDWVLVKRAPDGDETVVATSVAAYELGSNGDVVVSDGASIERIDASGARTRLAAARFVSSIVALALLGALCLSGCSGRAARADSVGVAECDDYIAKVQACMSSEPRLQAMAPGYRAQADAWKQMAKTNTQAVKANCQSALDGLAKAMPGCR